MLSEFFSKDLGEPAGIFSIEHLIFLGICLVLIFLALLATKNLNPKKIDRIILIIAILVTLLEIAKIVWNYQAGRRSKGVLYPLYYCSIFYLCCIIGRFRKEKSKRSRICVFGLRRFTGRTGFSGLSGNLLGLHKAFPFPFLPQHDLP